MKDCTPTGDCHFNKFRRPLYFHGMLLDEKGFRDEQEYHSQKRRLLNRMLHGSGVACGLKFKKEGDTSFTISCGLALDCGGYEIFVPCDVTVKVPKPEDVSKDPCAPKVRGREICYRIRISYRDEDTGFEQVLLPGGGCDDKTCKPTRKREGYCIKFDECQCPEERKPARCDDIVKGLDRPIQCSCGCDCACGEQHWVSLGTVRVTEEGMMVGEPSYACRDYLFSGQMLKQMLTPDPPASGDCACPDQFERLKDLLKLICTMGKQTNEFEQVVNKLFKAEAKTRGDELKSLQGKLDDRIRKVVELETRIKKLEGG
jgi:hypothetical protein